MDQEQEQLNQLREVLDARFSETELRNLCFALGGQVQQGQRADWLS